jgi:mRNA interferase MazF
MIEGSSFRRGDVVLARMPFPTDPTEQKVRPVLIIQNDVGNRFSANVIVAAVTSQLPRREYPTNVVLKRGAAEAQGSGLDRDSVVQTETITTVSKEMVTRFLGRLNADAMRAVDQCLRVSLGLT